MKLLSFFAMTLLLAFTPVNKKQQQNITISMPKEAWDVVQKGLSKLTIEEGAGVYSYINQQMAIQSAPAKPVVKDSTKKK